MVIVLSITAHLDDRENTSYGILKTLQTASDITHSLVFCNGRYMHDSELRTQAHIQNSAKLRSNDHLLGYPDLRLNNLAVYEISDIVYNKLNEIKPSIILIPSEEDLHQDHKLLSSSSKIAIQRYIRDLGDEVKGIKVVEVLSPSIFCKHEDYYTLKLNEDTLAQKDEALKLYTTEKLKAEEYEFFKVYSNKELRLNKKNVFDEKSLKNFLKS